MLPPHGFVAGLCASASFPPSLHASDAYAVDFHDAGGRATIVVNISFKKARIEFYYTIV